MFPSICDNKLDEEITGALRKNHNLRVSAKPN